MKNLELLKTAADQMVGDMLVGQPDAKALQFNVDVAGKAYRVNYELESEGRGPMWVFKGYEPIGA